MKKLLYSVLIFFMSSFNVFINSASADGKPSSIKQDVAWPDDIRIIKPDASVPASHAAFSGIWCGNWQSTLDACVIIEKIEGNTATLVYAWGRSPGWNIDNPGSIRYSAEFEDGQIHFISTSGAGFWLFDPTEDKVKISRMTSRYNQTTTLEKVK